MDRQTDRIQKEQCTSLEKEVLKKFRLKKFKQMSCIGRNLKANTIDAYFYRHTNRPRDMDLFNENKQDCGNRKRLEQYHLSGTGKIYLAIQGHICSKIGILGDFLKNRVKKTVFYKKNGDFFKQRYFDNKEIIVFRFHLYSHPFTCP